MLKNYFVAIISIFILASCVTSKTVNYLQEPSNKIPDYADTVTFQEYRLQKGDYLYIRVYSLNKEDVQLYNCGDNSQYVQVDNYGLCSYVIDENGYIDYPYIGEIYALGKTARQLKFEIEELFVKDIAKYVSIDLFLYNPTFSIIGEGTSRRVSMPSEKVTIFQALSMVGDLSTYADRSKVKLVRLTENGTIVKEFDLRSIKIIDSEFYYIHPNDVLYVQYSTPKYVGITHVSNVISLSLSTISFGLIVYRLADRISEMNKK